MLGRLANTSLNRFLKKLILADLIEVYSASQGRRLLKSRMLCAQGSLDHPTSFHKETAIVSFVFAVT